MSGNVAPILWYETDEGARWYPPADYDGSTAPPQGFRFQRFRNPFEVHDSICTDEGELCRGTQTYSGALALALCRPTLRQRIVATCRYGWPGPTMPLDVAILRAACSCERCINALAHRVGLRDGYREGSAAWQRSNTRCEFCEPEMGK